jgi:hypothetical protein
MRIAWDTPVEPEWWRLYGDFIRDQGPWHWWLTFTFQQPIGPVTAKRIFKRWAMTLAADHLRDHIRLAWVLDTNGGHFHFHALLGLPDNTSTTKAVIKDLWMAAAPGLTGYVGDIHEYDPGQGAAFYIGKKTAHYEWDITTVCSDRPACRRGKGCRVNRFAWDGKRP